MKHEISNNDNKFLLFINKNWHIITLTFIAMLSFFFNFYAISKYGYGNEYYAAAIKSMTQSFKNFFFLSFDPSGMVSIDKPPVGFWMQAISVLIFGYHGWAMLLPQALAGTGSCIMVYILVSKYFGRPSGLISAFIFSFTPSVVVASRNNTIDMQLIFVLLIAAWFLFKSIENGKKRDLFIAGALIGLGFNIKMLQAYTVLPAFALVYLMFAKEKLVKKFINGIITMVIVLVISFAWVFAVDLYPSDSRPYVDSSTNNTVMELIVGHNGLERIYGQSQGGGQQGGHQGDGQQGRPQDDVQQDGPQGDGQQGRPQGGGMGSGEIGTASIVRLWTSNLYGQASWLLTFAAFSILIFIRKFNMRDLTVKQSMLTFWTLWLGTMFTFFSFAGFYHRYYLCMFGPAIAALCGIGLVKMFEEFKNKNGIKQFILPISLITTIGIEIKYVWTYSQLKSWLVPIIAVAGVISLALMILNYIRPKKLITLIIGAFMLISMGAAPFYWALTPVMYVPNSTMPYAGPELASQSGKGMPQSGSLSENNKSSNLEQYLVNNYKEGSFLVVSSRADDVAQFIMDTGLPAYAYGGFLGSDNSLTVDKLKEYVSEGKITYFLVSGDGGMGGNSELTSYVKENATLIAPSEYGGSSSNQNQKGGPGSQSGSLYCFNKVS
ncbi:ArnT family glycosyltransferase [Clostridium saccharobutylicum]|uniref:Putative mannosyltransferase YkcB n=2 Tax=Clostridium saccharobutylicum TaxID=169679 RepID=U5MK27_CLOSA|nr:glycosyltransferase family 39 protein [Clostridium saccharobutylicum]AGX41169.1 putative mannosyltransferase YkcB [Clostridium saccharobutylicum DSM 13864]MBA8790643.1 4-amino-4-deoxy-L-arabinose transferase-like glycosyltransferase [Clostridium saccharobutylicum]MBA8994795.1 4-amino-4-deoxy-L-arabinose transferase-like glycosyltransferase [Clostridium saccharobutylicum]MBC2402242.1 glycosyltransferase family 39 protein [Clostridium saccharobutylicum]MBC2437039.1 glycosyltransferase family 